MPLRYPSRVATVTGALSAVVLPAASAHAAFTHEYISEFSLANNPNGVWEYRHAGTNAEAPSTSQLMTGTSFGAYWQGPAGDTYNLIGNDTSAPDAVDWHPGSSNDALITFVYPEASSSVVNAHMELRDRPDTCGGGTQTVTFWHNDVLLASETTVLPEDFNAVEPVVIDFNVTMNAGDRLYARLDADGSNACDGCGVQEYTLTNVPEPAAAASLLGLALATLAGRRRSR